MSAQEIMPALPVRTISDASIDDDVKRVASSQEDSKSLTEEQEAPEGKKATPKVMDVFLGRDRTTLREDPIVWNKGFGTFTHTLGKRLKNIFTMRFL